MFPKGRVLCLSWLRRLIQWVWAHHVKSILTRLHLLLCTEARNHFKSLFQRFQKEQASFFGLFYSPYLQVSWEQAAEVGSFVSSGPQACSLQLGEQEAACVRRSWRCHGHDCDAGYPEHLSVLTWEIQQWMLRQKWNKRQTVWNASWTGTEKYDKRLMSCDNNRERSLSNCHHG